MFTNEDFFREIGHISIFFATLDLIVSQAIAELTSNGLPFDNDATLGQKLNRLSKLQPKDVNDPKKLTNLQSYLPRAQDAAKERNRYIHDQWVFEPNLISQGRIRRVRFKYSQNTSCSQELSIQDLTVFRVELGEIQKFFAEEIKSWSPA